MQFRLSDVKPNPFRRLDHYPIIREKVDELKESFKATGFWQNLVGREVKGKLEIAYGHNRLAALKELYEGSKAFEYQVLELTDAQMIQMMTRENSTAYRSSIQVLIESVRVTIAAYAQGVITAEEMPPPKMGGIGSRSDVIRNAPSFLPGISGADTHHPYTVLSLAIFLGLTKKGGSSGVMPASRLTTVMDALELKEEGFFSEAAQVSHITIGELEQAVADLRERRDYERERAAELAAKKRKAKADADREAAEGVAQVAEAKAVAKREAAEVAKAEAKAAWANASAKVAERKQKLADKADADAMQAEAKAKVAKATAAKALKELEVIRKKEEKAKLEQDAWDKAEEKRKAANFFEDAREKASESANVKLMRDIVRYGFLHLSKMTHPDKQGGSDERMKLLNAAKERLDKLIREPYFLS